jgi:hypothetical protein
MKGRRRRRRAKRNPSFSTWQKVVIAMAVGGVGVGLLQKVLGPQVAGGTGLAISVVAYKMLP